MRVFFIDDMSTFKNLGEYKGERFTRAPRIGGGAVRCVSGDFG